MPMEFHRYDAQDTAPSYGQTLPEMGTTQPTPYPPPPAYDHIAPAGNLSHPINVIHPAPYFVNNQEMFQKPPEYTPPYPGSEISGPIPPGMVSSPPLVTGSSEGPMTHRIMPVPQYPLQCHFRSSGYPYPIQGMVVTTQSTTMVKSPPRPIYKDYMTWSILNAFFLCSPFGFLALIFSSQTRSANRRGNWESARRKSHVALSFNIIAVVTGITLNMALAVYYGAFYRRYYYSYSYHG